MITIDKAIEILKLHRELNLVDKNPDLRDAIKLGIEALTYIVRLRAFSLQHRQARLPSEEKDTSRPDARADLSQIKESPLGREPKD